MAVEDLRAPPYDETAERAVLGSILIDAMNVMDVCVEKEVSPVTFHVPRHRQAYEAILDLQVSARAIDAIVFTTHLRENNLLDSCGGQRFVEELIENTPTAANAAHYIEIIKRKEKRRKLIAAARRAESDALDETLDVDEALNAAQSSLFEIAKAHDVPQTNADALVEQIQVWRDASKGKKPGLPCFLKSIENVLGSYRLGKVYYIGARPRGGKTTFVCNLIRHWSVTHEIPTATASVEMGHPEILGKIVAEMADVSTFSLDYNLSKTDSSEPEIERVIEKAKVMCDWETGEMLKPLFVNDRIMDLDSFCTWARLMVHKHGVKAIGLDYIQLMSPGLRFKGTQTEGLVHMAQTLQILAKELNVVLVVVSQIRDEARHDRKPRPSDLFGTRSMENAAFGIIMLYQWLDEETGKSDQWFADVQKHKGGSIGAVRVDFNKSKQRWEQAIPTWEEGEGSWKKNG